ncbi:hypothetical protein AB0F18_29525 [Streptomyces sp. NPDC029216]
MDADGFAVRLAAVAHYRLTDGEPAVRLRRASRKRFLPGTISR